MFRWNDGRQYSGYWANGKQHGPGIYTKPNSDKTKFGIWEQGRVVTWLENESEIENVNVFEYLKDAYSRRLLPRKCTFHAPKRFY